MTLSLFIKNDITFETISHKINIFMKKGVMNLVIKIK